MCDDPSVSLLVTRAQTGDQQAWNALVERYAPLVWSICRRYQLGGADASDAGQNVWLHLVDQLGNIRDPAALPGWLPRPGGNVAGSYAHATPRPHSWYRTPRTSPASRPILLSKNRSPLSATRLCGRRSPTSRQAASA